MPRIGHRRGGFGGGIGHVRCSAAGASSAVGAVGPHIGTARAGDGPGARRPVWPRCRKPSDRSTGRTAVVKQPRRYRRS